ncbi:MAG: protein kinase [Prosthecobacter sp.]|uniref:serine/threonine protein kinase n=1 Tax=Prosthecobacter sp. TaxID=1965333 RepID=UPI0025D30CC3|nr:protein kinase [Prosthecobacter sp.]MCF7786397.1 protein kinase [Prosthecobacter sp.]
MSSRFEILRPLEEDTASKLLLVRDNKRGDELRLRRFKTTKQEEIEGLQELFRQLANLENPHLDRLIDFGSDKDGFYTIVAGPLPGETLSEVLERGPLTEKEFESVATQLMDAVSALHEEAIVHGSLRPDFVRISGKSAADWQVTLHGFGQGFAGRTDSKEEQIRAYRCTAPEQWEDGTTRRRTDVYALGCILYEALTARAPFDGRALKELKLKHLGHDLKPLEKIASHVPGWMCDWVMHLMAVDPEQRPRKAGAAMELYQRREAPNLTEPPPRQEPATETAHTKPPITFLQQPQSAPVILPNPQQGARNATSSTIPISPGPHLAASRPKRPATALMPAQRKISAILPRKSTPPKLSASLAKNIKPIAIAAAAIILMLIMFTLPHCGQKSAPAKNGTAQKQH